MAYSYIAWATCISEAQYTSHNVFQSTLRGPLAQPVTNLVKAGPCHDFCIYMQMSLSGRVVCVVFLGALSRLIWGRRILIVNLLDGLLYIHTLFVYFVPKTIVCCRTMASVHIARVAHCANLRNLSHTYLGIWLNMVFILVVVTVTIFNHKVKTITCYNHITI